MTDFEEMRREDLLLGQLLVRRKYSDPAVVKEGLAEQAKIASSGAQQIPRLGEILFNRGAVSQAHLDECLKFQLQSTIMRCNRCGTDYRVGNFDPAHSYLCRKAGCGAKLESPSFAIRTRKAASVAPSGRTDVLADAPEDVRAAAKIPGNWLDKYLLISELGRGGMGVVYRAYDTKLKRFVAAKFLFADSSKPQAEAKAELERFTQEAQIAAQLVHPNIPQIFEIGEVEGRHLIAMELVDGAPCVGKRLPLKKALATMLDISRAIDYAHSKNVVHRDIKPSNIIVDKAGKPYIMDFGLAKSTTVSKKLTVSGPPTCPRSRRSGGHARSTGAATSIASARRSTNSSRVVSRSRAGRRWTC